MRELRQNIAYHITAFVFPIALIAIEGFLKSILKVDSISFIGCSLSAAALSFLLPATKLSSQDIREVNGKLYYSSSIFDKNLSGASWFFIIVFLVGWIYNSYVSITGVDRSFSLKYITVDWNIFIGFMSYFISFMISLLKEGKAT